MKQFARLVIAGLLVGMAALHHFIPSVDAVSLALAVLALALFLAPWLESLEIPGLIKIGYRQVSEAGKKITGAEYTALQARDAAKSVGSLEAKGAATSRGSFDVGTRFVLAENWDPNLSLVAMRIEIEKRLRRLAALSGVDLDRTRSLQEIVRRLGRRGEGQGRGLLSDEMVSGLLDLIRLGNNAAHGARVDQSATDWSATVGPGILEQLDDIIESQPTGS